MGMSIDNVIATLKDHRKTLNVDKGVEFYQEIEALNIAINTMLTYDRLRTDYETRLKADMVAMLTELQLEIEELDTPNNGSAYMDCVDIIQQKINALKDDEK